MRFNYFKARVTSRRLITFITKFPEIPGNRFVIADKETDKIKAYQQIAKSSSQEL